MRNEPLRGSNASFSPARIGLIASKDYVIIVNHNMFQLVALSHQFDLFPLSTGHLPLEPGQSRSWTESYTLSHGPGLRAILSVKVLD